MPDEPARRLDAVNGRKVAEMSREELEGVICELADLVVAKEEHVRRLQRMVMQLTAQVNARPKLVLPN